MSRPKLDLEGYAALAAALAVAGDEREARLAEHGLDERRWNEIEDGWQVELSAAEEEHGDRDGVPPLLAAFAEAFARAQQAQAGAVLPFDRYLRITRILSRGKDVAAVLEREGLSLATYLHTHQHWTQRMAQDPELAAKWQQALGPTS